MSESFDHAAASAARACTTLATFPEPLPATIRAALAELHGAAVPDEAMAATFSATVRDLCEAVESAEIGLDLLRVLRGERPVRRSHVRAVVAANLRARRRQLGRALVNADWPRLHRLSLFACVYWGGIEAWSAGAANRAQRPKHFWADRGNQIAAIRRFRADHPDLPITNGTLRMHGFPGLTIHLTAAELDALCDEAGFGRDLACRPDGWWTAERVMDRYAALCREAGITLSAHALVLTGGEASSLRIYAKRHFATFRAFQAAVHKRHPDIRLPYLPTANDGTLLDSWSEVVVYHALRAALPDVPMALHVVLPGEDRRSTDFVLDGRIFVEVLSLSVAAIAAASTKRERKYARNWRIKQARYQALGIVPVIIEPGDVHDGTRLADCIQQVAAALDCTAAVLPLPTTMQVRAKGTWSHDMLLDAVREVAGATGRFPTYAALQAAGYGHAAILFRRPGLRLRVSQALGLTDRTARGYWNEQRVVEALAEWVRMHGTYPTKAALLRDGQGYLASARDRLWIGRKVALRAAVAALAGISVAPARAPNGSYDTLEKVAGALRPLAQTLGRMPTLPECVAAGLSTAWAVGRRRWGVAVVAAAIGTEHAGPKRRTHEERLALLATVPGRMTTSAVLRHLGSGGVAMVYRCGGIEAVRRAIGR